VTLANKITIVRICLIPVFAAVTIAYSATGAEDNSDERLRWLAAAIFIVAAATDGVDGFVARRFNQRSRLGAILDPLADKGLIFTALILLTIKLPAFPPWFPISVIGRDLALIAGYILLSTQFQPVEVHPSLMGKLATILQIISILFVLTGFRWIDLLIPVILATGFTLASGVGYAIAGILQLVRHRKC
jgi:CDP-diacylglycerol--glycerol-3-phosphate 3-phosphatidyltransferase